MDSKQFDELVARLAKGPSRREALKGVVGGALAAVGVTAAADAKKKGRGGGGADAKKKGRRGASAQGKKGRGRVGPEGCIPTGKKCPSKKPRGKKKKNLQCSACCQGATTTGASGQTVCACKVSGTGTASACTATTAYQCCSGICGTVGGVANRCRDY